MPVIMLCTSPFRGMAEAILKTKGQADVRLVEVDHPLGGIGADDLEQRIAAAAARVLEFIEAGE